MKLRQYRLISIPDRREKLCWLDATLRIGQTLTLKQLVGVQQIPVDREKRWYVADAYEQVVEASDIKRGWNNNI